MIRYGAYAARQTFTLDAPVAQPKPAVKVEFGPIKATIPQPKPGLARLDGKMAAIVEDVMLWSGVSPQALFSDRRARYVAHPRQLAMWLAFKCTSLSIPKIGRKFGRDHTTVLHAINMVEDRIATNPIYREVAMGMLDKHKPADEQSFPQDNVGHSTARGAM